MRNSEQNILTPDSICLVEDAPDSIITFTGRVVRPLSPDPETICIEDIAHALSNQCRFTGHTRQFYSVAQHSVMVSWMVYRADGLHGLLHDASEAYLSDLARPLKYTNGLGDVYREAEKKLQQAIWDKFCRGWKESIFVKMADDVMLVREAATLMPKNFPLNEEQLSDSENIEPFSCWMPDYAEQMFLQRYKELTSD